MVALLATMGVCSIQTTNATTVGVSLVTGDAQKLCETITTAPGYDIWEYVRPAVVETTENSPIILNQEALGAASKDAYMPIYVREGQLIMTDGVTLNYLEPDNGCHLQVAGKNASMIVSNDATFTEDPAALAGYLDVGGPDGAGKLELKSGGSIRLYKSLTAGYWYDASWDASQTVYSTCDSTDDNTRYSGGDYETITYQTASGETLERSYGKAEIIIDGDNAGTEAKKRTTLEMGTAIFLAQADLTIKNGGLLQTGTKLTESQNDPAMTYNAWEGCNILGRQHGSTTNINIQTGGELQITGSLITWSGDIRDVTVNISIDGIADQDYGCGVEKGTASKLSVSHILGLGTGNIESDNGTSSSETTMTVTNGGVVEASDVRLGLDDGGVGETSVYVSIDEKSSMKADCIRLGKGATVINRGTVTRLNPAAGIMRAGMSPMIITDGATWTNSGTLDMDVVLQNGGTFIAEDGSVSGGLTSSSNSTVSINGDVTFNGDVSISNTLLTFGVGSQVTANGTFEIDGQSTVKVVVNNGDSATGTLFTVSSWDETADAPIAITLINANGDTCGWGQASISGNGAVSLVQSIATEYDLSRNEQAFFSAMQKLAISGAAPDEIMNVLNSHDSEAVKAAIDAMSGHEYATAMSSQIEGNLGHLRRLHGAMGKGTALGSYVVIPGSKGSVDEKGNEVLAATPAVTDSRNWRVGVSAFHEETSIDSDARGDGYDRSETGAMLNVEYLMNKELTLGGALSYGRTNLRTNGAARRHEDNTRFDVYALYGQKRWSFATSLGLGMHEHELLGGDVDGYSINFLQDAAYTVLSREKDNVQVFGTIESSWNEIDSFSDGTVRGGSQDAWATDVTAGVRYNRALRAFGNAPAGVFTAQTGVTASIGDIKSGVDMSLDGYGYRQESATRNRWGWNLGAGVDVPVRTNVSVYGAAEAVLRGDSSSVDGQVGVKVSF